MHGGWKPWLSTTCTNASIAILVAVMIRLVGLGPFLLVHLPITALASSICVWLFYVQHQFEDTPRSNGEAWSFHEAALRGSSYYHLPVSCAGSQRTSAYTTSITFAVGFPAIGCQICGIRFSRLSVLTAPLPEPLGREPIGSLTQSFFWRNGMKNLAIYLAVGASALLVTAASAAPLSAEVSIAPEGHI